MPSSGIAGSYGSPIFSFLRTLHTVLHSGCVNLHPTHQRSKAPISPWPGLHFWFGHFFLHGPFARWEARLLWSADLPFQVAWLAKKGIIVLVLPLFMCFQDDSNLLPEIFFLQFCLAFKVSSLPSLNIFLKERYHLKLCRFVNCRPLSSIFQLAFLGAGRKSAGLLQALFWFWGAG